LRVLEELRRGDCLVNTVDMGGARTSADADVEAQRIGANVMEGGLPNSVSGGADSGQDSLFLLARDTGGEMVRSENDLGRALDRVLERTSLTYVLTFQPEDPRADGAYHRLQVKLKGAPRGARVSHRAGYYAPRYFADQSAAERDFAAAQLLMAGGDGGSIESAVLAVPLPGGSTEAGSRADVAVVLDIAGPSMLAGHWGEDLPAQIYLYAITDSGAIADHLAQRLTLDLRKMGGSLQQGGIRFLGQLGLAPGRYSLRALVRNERTGDYALRSSVLEIPAFGSGAPSVSTPVVPAFSGAWIPARSPRWSTAPPFTLDARPFMPSPLALLRTGQPTRLWLPTANLPAGELVAEGRLLTADGKVAATMPIEVARGAEQARLEPLVLTAAGVAATVPEGSYTLVIAVRTADGGVLTSAPAPAYVLQGS
jgi:hypothetical protein